MAPDKSAASRRAFVKQGLGLGLGLAGSGPAGATVAEALAGYKPTVLTRDQLATLKALMSRLIPADERHGGAIEAGAYVYVDRALGAFHARHADIYRAGLAEVDRQALQQHFSTVGAMPPSAMDALIAHMEKGELTGGAFADGGLAFFNLVRRHTLEGFLSDPMYGGNQNFLGWDVIGFPGVQLFYSIEAQRLNGRDERDQRSIADFGGSPKL